MPSLMFVLGHSGSGKTSIVRSLVDELEWRPRERPPKFGPTPAAAWLETTPPKIAIFGRFSGHHNRLTPTVDSRTGRLDGCDRIHWGAVKLCTQQVPVLRRAGVELIICDGVKLLTTKFLAAARRSGFHIHFLETAVGLHQASRRKKTRETAALAAGLPRVRTVHTVKNEWWVRRKRHADTIVTMPNAQILTALRKASRAAIGATLPDGRVGRLTAQRRDGPRPASRQTEQRRAADRERKQRAAAATSSAKHKKELAARRRGAKQKRRSMTPEAKTLCNRMAAKRVARHRLRLRPAAAANRAQSS